MKSRLLQMAAALSSQELIERVKQLAKREGETTAELVAHIAELENRRLHLVQGWPSLFSYCTRVLHLSESAAYTRIQAARVCRRLPLVLDKLAEGSVNLTTVGVLCPHLTPKNHVELLEEAAFKTRKEVEEIVARLHPIENVPEFVRKLPNRPLPTALPQQTGEGANGPPPSLQPLPQLPGELPQMPELPARTPQPFPQLSTTSSALRSSPPEHKEQSTEQSLSQLHRQQSTPALTAPRALITPIAPQRYKIQFTAGAGTFNKLQRARDLLRHQVPDGNPATVFDRALTVLVSDLERKRFAAVSRPVTARGPRPRDSEMRERWTRYIPAEVRRAVWQRDGGRCAYVDARGERCLERGWLEFHHVRPHALGGPPSADNLELRCRAHNQFEAELVFGQE